MAELTFWGMVLAGGHACLVASGCAVGPDFKPPAAPLVKSYTAGPPASQTEASPGEGGAPQRLLSGAEIPARWWELFQSEPLDRLIRQALAESPTLESARATLSQAQENYRARSGTEYFPKADATLSGTRQKATGAAFGQPGIGSFIFGLYNATVSVSYALDLFGGGRRELEGLQAQVDYQRFQLEGARLALTANIATAAVKEASLRGQIAASREVLALEQKQLEVVERQYRLGAVSRADVLAQETQLAQTGATLPPLEQALAQTRHQLSVYAGCLPGEGGLPEFLLDKLQLPQKLPVSLPSSLLRQRPDIRGAEELLHAASAQVGVATANLYPQITLTGSFGSQAPRLQDLFASGTSVWGLGASLTQPIFHGGELSAKRRAALAAYDQAAAQYRETVLQAFQNVADVLRALESDAATLAAQAAAETAALDTFQLTGGQYRLGGVSYLALLNAERQYQQSRIGRVQAEAARFSDSAALFQALGGGWWNRPAAANDGEIERLQKK